MTRLLVSAIALVIGLATVVGIRPGRARARPRPSGSGSGPTGARPRQVPPATARASAPKDFTGYWVSVVTEHWHLRMLVPPRGDYAMLPLNPRCADCRLLDLAKAKATPTSARPPSPPHSCECLATSMFAGPTTTRAADRLRHADARAPIWRRAPPAGQGAAAAGLLRGVVGGILGARGRGGGARKPPASCNTDDEMGGGYLKGTASRSARTHARQVPRRVQARGDTWLVVTSIVNDPKYLPAPTRRPCPSKDPGSCEINPTPCRADEPR